MNIQHHTQPDQLERYSFIWSEIRLIVAALALFIGGIPPVLALVSSQGLYSPLLFLHKLAWIISGVAAAYLLYRWNQSGRKLFGSNLTSDTIAFFVSVVSGINLGLTGLLGTNIGMGISSNRLIFFIVGLLYLISTVYLYRRWKQNSKKLFN